jgi:Holliday junction resolvasome RuvABC DNA-binding subunit
MKTAIVVVSFILLLAPGCGADKSKQVAPDEQKPSAGRSDTKAIEAATAVGYDGSAMRRSVDKALNQADARAADQKKAIEQATGK